MKSSNRRLMIFFVCVGLTFFLAGQKQIQAQEVKRLNLWDVRKVLIFKPSAKTSVAELNEELIKDVSKRGVNFILSEEDEESLKKAGATDLLIGAIRKNLPKKLEEKILLYQKFIDNYDKSFEHKRIALEAAKEFIKKYDNCEGDKEIIEYLKLFILESGIH